MNVITMYLIPAVLLVILSGPVAIAIWKKEKASAIALASLIVICILSGLLTSYEWGSMPMRLTM